MTAGALVAPAGAQPTQPAVRAPGDSVQGALAGLEAARAKVSALEARGAELHWTAEHERRTADRREGDWRREVRRRAARAAAMYRNSGPGVPIGSTQQEELADDRNRELFVAGDLPSRRLIRTRREEAAFLRASAVAHDVERMAVESARAEAVAVRDTLAEKLANAGGRIVTVRPPAPIGAAGTPVAQRADRAAAALRATAGEKWNEDPRWLEARHDLTRDLVARSGTRTATVTIELEWDATPKQALVAVLAALRQVGRGYVYATAGPSTFDCSGLTKRAYAEAGLGIPHFSATQLRLGAPVRRDQMRAGDLIAYGPGGADHVAMYVGAGIAVEARGSAERVVVNPARTGATFAGVTRLLP